MSDELRRDLVGAEHSYEISSELFQQYAEWFDRKMMAEYESQRLGKAK